MDIRGKTAVAKDGKESFVYSLGEFIKGRFCMKKIIEALKNMPGVFDRAIELSSSQYAGFYIADVNELLKKHELAGIERDRANFLRDRRNLASDLRNAVNAAKQKIGV
jgi:copper chaperone CopZ